jgi:hypothetical protein
MTAHRDSVTHAGVGIQTRDAMTTDHGVTHAARRNPRDAMTAHRGSCNIRPCDAAHRASVGGSRYVRPCDAAYRAGVTHASVGLARAARVGAMTAHRGSITRADVSRCYIRPCDASDRATVTHTGVGVGLAPARVTR